MSGRSKSEDQQHVESLRARIDSVQGDIDHIRQQRGVSRPSKRTGPRYPRTKRVLQARLSELEARRNEEHTKWLRERGEQLYQPPFDKLLAAGIISPYSKPEKRGRGRPRSTRGKDASLVVWTDFIHGILKTHGKSSRRRAIAIATKIPIEALRAALNREKESDRPSRARIDLIECKIQEMQKVKDEGSRKGLPAYWKERRYYQTQQRRRRARTIRP